MKKKYIIVSIISVLIMMIGISYAYFTSAVVGEGKKISVKANRLAVIFTDTEKIAEEEITPGWNVSKTFTVENRSGGVFYYDINIDNLINTFVTEGYLQYKITSTDGGYNMDEYADIPKSTNIEDNEEEVPSEEETSNQEQEEIKRTNLVKNIQIEDKGVHTYKVEFRYIDSVEDQSADMGKVFSGSLSITESKILVVKYKVEGIIQDEIPDKEEPYIVESVECSNRAKGTWNEERETVDLESAVTQTVCIVEFKEGNTITMSSEHGEVVSPISKVVGRIGETTFTIEEKAGYILSDAAIVCDNGAEGSISNKTITIRNIKQNNTCKVITNPISITVTYDVNGGNALNPNSKEVIYTSTYGSLPTPTRTGYTFNGWYTGATGGSKVTEDTEVTSTSNHTIYARWTANTITLTLNGQSATNGGTGAVYYRYNTATYYSNSALSTTITKITVPTRTGYTFGGYYTSTNGGGTQYIKADGAFVNNPYTKVTANITLYAKWTANTITLTLNGQSATSAGTGAVYYRYNTATYYSNSALSTTITKITVPTRTGYTFGGYYTSTNGGGTQYIKADGTFVNNPYTAITGNMTLYAKWTANTITLTLNGQSATSAGTGAVYYKYNTATYYSNSALSTTITKITVPTRTGYTFGGYYTSTNGGGTQYINASGAFVNNPYTKVTANITLYAKWTANTYTVTVNVTNGTVTTTNPLTVNHGSNVTFTIKANTDYKLANAIVSCANGTFDESTGRLTVSNVTSSVTCSITLEPIVMRFSIAMNEYGYKQDTSSACYILSQYCGVNSSSPDNWDHTAIVGSRTYTNCSLISYTKKTALCNMGVSITWSNEVEYSKCSSSGGWYSSPGSEIKKQWSSGIWGWDYRYKDDGSYYTDSYCIACSVVLECS